MDEVKEIARMLKVLANENRLLILCALIGQPMTPAGIAKHVPGITQSALSQHLTLLKAHNYLDSKKSGQNIIYSVADKRVENTINVLRKYYCRSQEKKP
ncbi:MAG: metalloregulator ArsR/SmtB family transcription factor [Treponema sp.]|nr:metalloregulator ArsR/SmtB family transcription factor [Treponema sp.]